MLTTLSSRALRRLGLAGLLGFGHPGLQAQTLPPTAEPFRVERSLKPSLRPDSVPRAKVPLIEEQLAPKDAASVDFLFRSLIIEGNSAVPTATLAALWPHQPGSKVGVDELFAFANSISKFYSDQGYALCFAVIPQQEIKDGVIRIVVVEGHVSSLTSSAYMPSGLASRAVRKQLVKILASQPLRSETLERNLLLMDDLPGWEATAVLNPDVKVVGGSSLDVRFVRQPGVCEASWSTFLPKGLGRSLLSANLGKPALWDDSDEFTAGIFVSPGSSAYRSFSSGYSLLAGNDGERMGLGYSQSDSRPQDAVLLPLEYRGFSRSLRAFFSSPLRRNRANTVNLECYASLQESRSSMNAGTPVDDRLPAIGVSLTFDFISADRSSNLLKLGLEQGLNCLGAHGNSRANGRNDFTAATLDYVRTAPLFNLGSGQVSYSLSVQAQASLSGAMFSMAESSYGGRQFGRSFDSGLISGEHAAYASCELRYGQAFLAGAAEPINAQFFGFVDGGYVRQQGELQPQEARSRQAASLGMGVRLGLPYGMNALVEVSRPMTLPTGFSGSASSVWNASLGVRF